MPTLTQRFMPEGATLASGVREALSDGGVAVYLNLDPKVSLDVEYLASSGNEPDGASPAWTLGGTDQSSIASSELTIADTGASSTEYSRTEAGTAATSPALIGMRAKWSAGNDGIDFQGLIRDGTREVGFGFNSAKIEAQDNGAFRTHGTSDLLIDTSAYHVYELCKIKNTRVDLYLDGRLLFSTPYSAFRTVAVNGFAFGAESGANTATVILTTVYYKISTLWLSTSPTFDKDFDSGSDDTTWDMSTIKMVENLFGEEGNVKYQYGAGNSAAPTLNGSFLTEAQIQAESDPTGRFLRIQGQLNGDGSQDAGWGGFEIAMTTSAAGGGRLVHSSRGSLVG